MKYVLGLDVGIGSVGWAVIRNEEDKKRIEDFGVRIFDSGEVPNKKERYSQERRQKREARRLIRRRSHRKLRLKNHFSNIGLTTIENINKYFETCSSDIISLRVKAINEKVSPEELTACLINICNHRGYRDFYENDLDGLSSEEKKQAELEQGALNKTAELMKKGNYRTVAELIANDDYFQGNGVFRKYRNSDFNDETIMFKREMLQNEVDLILKEQQNYYKQLTDSNIEKTKAIIFSQRDFEDGPGDVNDKYRKYMGFLDSVGNCSFYKDEKRGFRSTLIADLYSLINLLSQCKFIDETTGETYLSKELAKVLFDYALKNGGLTKNELKKLCKENCFTVNNYEGDGEQSFSNCFKFTKKIKPIFENNGYNWEELSSQYNDMKSLLNRVSIVLAENITPKRRIAKLKSITELNNEIINDLKEVKTSGTSNVSYKFMQDSIKSFLNGDIIGNFQSRMIKESTKSTKKYDILPPFNDMFDFFDNPVVFRAINETRKIINAIVRKYGAPDDLNIEIASELNKSLENRKKDIKRINENKKSKESAVKTIAEITNKKESDINQSMIERYILGEEQGWKCLYSGVAIEDKAEAILNNNKLYEVDHIIPFSLILDDTLSNKALVLHSENQAKKQQTPLMYMDNQKAKDFKARVNAIYNNIKGREKKYRYLLLPNLNDYKLLDEWKSRNLNDTRYISKFLVNYISFTLKFKDDSKKHVYAVKGAITSMLRRQWLNKDTWGTSDKGKLKEITYLDHAVDAIVIANCIPGYVEIASLNRRLKDIFYSSGKVYTKEYTDVLEKGMDSLQKFYGISRKESEPMLRKIKSTPSLVPDLRHEVDLRVMDCDMVRYFYKSQKDKSDEEIIEVFNKNVKAKYNDPAFSDSVQMPQFSLKPSKKINKRLGDDNPISIKEINGKLFKISSIPVSSLEKKDVEKVLTNDPALISALNRLFDGLDDKKTGRDAFKDKDIPYLTVNGVRVNKIKKAETLSGIHIKKNISDNNYTNLSVSNYYCIDVYKDESGKTKTCGIPYVYLVLKNGKLYLSPDYKYPEKYKEHIDYIFIGDYVTVFDENGNIKVSGYYKGAKTIGKSRYYFVKNNNISSVIESISSSDSIKKAYIDLLGRKAEINKRCGELSLLTEVKD